MTTSNATTSNATTSNATAPRTIWYHNSRKRIYDTPTEQRWERQWEKLEIVSETSRSYVLANGVKVPKNPAMRDAMEFALTDEAHAEAIWNHYNYLRVTSALQAMARSQPQMTRELDALLAKYDK